MEAHDPSTTPDKLIDVASQMFARRGVDAVSIRSITRAAGVGAAAIHYHFRSKDALLDAIIKRHSTEVLDDIETRALQMLRSPAQPTAWDFVNCVAEPYFQLLDSHPREGAEWLMIVGQLARTQDDRATRGSESTTEILHQLTRRVFPGASAEQCELAAAVAISTLLTLLGQQRVDRSGAMDSSQDARRLIVDFVAGGLSVAADRT